MTMYVRYAVLHLSVFVWLLGGCTGAFQGPRPDASRLLTTTAPLWQQLQLRRNTYQTLRGLAQFRVSAPAGGGTLDNTVFVLDRFDNVRLEGIGPFGQPLFLYTFAEQRFALYLPQQQQVFAGGATPEPFVRLIGLAVEPSLLPYVLVGDIPLAAWPVSGPLAYLADDDLYYWEGEAPASPWRYRVWFDPYRLLPVRLELADASKQTVLSVTYDDFQTLDGFTLPYRITLAEPRTRRQVVWIYNDVEFNPEVAASLFHMRVPPGTQRIELGPPVAHRTPSGRR